MKREPDHGGPTQPEPADGTGAERVVDELEERILGAPKDQVRDEDDVPDAPAFDQDLDDPGGGQGTSAEPPS